MAKGFAGDHCNKVCADAVQIFGGNGFNTECAAAATPCSLARVKRHA